MSKVKRIGGGPAGAVGPSIEAKALKACDADGMSMKIIRECNPRLVRGVLALIGVQHQEVAERMGVSPQRFSQILSSDETASERFRNRFLGAIQQELCEALFPERSSK